MSDFTIIKRRISVRVAGAPDPMMDIAIRDAARKFSKSTRLWRESISIDSITGENDLISIFPDVDIFEIERASFNGYELMPKSIAELDDLSNNWEALEAGAPRYITQYQPNSVRLVPISDTASDLLLRVFLMPSNQATTLPDWMVNKYHEIIADGAIADLSAIPNQEFTNSNIANHHNMLFESAINKLMMNTIRGQQRAKARTKTQYF